MRALAKRYPLDLKRVATVGHSAGALGALWVASRATLPAGSPLHMDKPLPVIGAVSLDGPGELERFIGVDKQVCGTPVIVPLMGGTPAEVPDRYRDANPRARLPFHAKQVIAWAEILDPAAAADYVQDATAKGDSATLGDLSSGGHFGMMVPSRDEGKRVISDTAALLGIPVLAPRTPAP